MIIKKVKGKSVSEEELLGLFEPDEGSINMYYGRIGQGKTYNATADILELLTRGEVVYCNWIINFDGFDERNSFRHLFWKTVAFRKRFYVFKKENLHYFSPDDVSIEFLGSLTDCHVYIDEGQWIFDSYEGTKFSVEKKRLILHTRHVNRTLNIISQRTQAIQVTARGQVNRFYKCEKKAEWPWLIFRRYEFQDMVGQDVDENAEPLSVKTYFAKRKVMDAYNSKYLRSGVLRSQEVHFEAYDLSFKEKIQSMVLRVVGRFSGHEPVDYDEWVKQVPRDRCMPSEWELEHLTKWDRGLLDLAQRKLQVIHHELPVGYGV